MAHGKLQPIAGGKPPPPPLPGDGLLFIVGFVSDCMMLSMLNDFIGVDIVVDWVTGGGSDMGGTMGTRGMPEDDGAAMGLPKELMFCNLLRLSISSWKFFGSLKRFRRRRKLPFSNMSRADGCSAQKAPLPGRSGRRGILMKQSLKERLCRREFCQRCVLRR